MTSFTCFANSGVMKCAGIREESLGPMPPRKCSCSLVGARALLGET